MKIHEPELDALMAKAGVSFGTTVYPIHHSEPEHMEGIAPGRFVVDIPDRSWPTAPDRCRDYSGRGEWILDGSVLVCSGCGLDVT